MEILKVVNLTKEYGKKENKFKAVDNVSFTVEKGEFIAIVGKSGSGKSTLMHMLGGVDTATKGEIYINGENIVKYSKDKMAKFRRDNIGIVYQFFNLLPVLNVKENIALPLNLDKKKLTDEKLEELLGILDLKGQEGKLPNQLSGGQQQRVSIGRAIVADPSIILADEPTGNLDTKNAGEIMKILKKSNKELNQTIIMITHDLDIAKQTDRIITIADGKIISDERNGEK